MCMINMTRLQIEVQSTQKGIRYKTYGYQFSSRFSFPRALECVGKDITRFSFEPLPRLCRPTSAGVPPVGIGELSRTFSLEIRGKAIRCRYNVKKGTDISTTDTQCYGWSSDLEGSLEITEAFEGFSYPPLRKLHAVQFRAVESAYLNYLECCSHL
ncbi:hypothetical protein OUZ56_019459 [Daphnia magna]|uniref:Uncharacterized protein n=1 Tax=Daphnia magna TaxID=35525 RepID=A0ABQ9ZC90_9CRUS|nr:hypothetical protein OUZ56_019459 [Daphnia magna]